MRNITDMIKFVKIYKDRNCRDGMYEVIEVDGNGSGQIYILRHVESKQKMSLYAAHTYEDMETKKASVAARIEYKEKLKEKAKTIGMKKRR